MHPNSVAVNQHRLLQQVWQELVWLGNLDITDLVAKHFLLLLKKLHVYLKEQEGGEIVIF